MGKGVLIQLGALFLISFLIIGLAVAGDPKPECDDKIDNDGDGNIDYKGGDTGCDSKSDNDETDCGDGVCEGGETSGSCPADCGEPDSCNDTDGGNVITVFGTTSGYYNNTPYSNDDYCVDNGTINEYYCSGNYEQSQQQSCGTDFYGSNYCNDSSVYRDYTDYYCSSGECDSTVTPELVETCVEPEECVGGECVIPNSCSDTDSGQNVAVQGTASGYFNEFYYNDTDFCLDNSTIVEFYCIGDYEYNATYYCWEWNLTTCSSGACS